MAGLFHTASPRSLPINIELEPVYNVLNSVALLNEVQRMPALDAWAVRTAGSLTPGQRRSNRLIFEALGGALLPDQDFPDFPAYLADLAAQRPTAVRDKAFAHLRAAPADAALQAEAQALLDDPPALHDLITSHLRAIWEAGLAAEWKRVLPPLQKMVAIAQHRPQPEAAAIAENLRTFIARDAPTDADVERIICVPSPHTGRYVMRLYRGTTLRLFFHGPSNYAVVMRTSPVGRAELLAQLTGLADETRLRILGLFATQNELSAQEIMARLDLSQSSASRHLKQLSSYLIERRGEGASKLYTLGPTKVDQTFHALQRLLYDPAVEAEQLQDVRADLPRTINRFLDEQGRLLGWPSKRRDQLLLLEYLAAQFEPRRDYTEKEVNALLIQHMHPVFKDYAIVRRALYDYRFIDRERDGSRYWRVEANPIVTEVTHD